MKTLNYKNLLLVIVLPPFDLEKLLREDNGALGKTYVYTYDNAGNITSKKTYSLTAAGVTPTSPELTYSYGYSASGWGDMLTSYSGQSISYDAIGNPLSYYNGYSYTFTWTGRQLTGATYKGKIYTFVYNDEGIRTSKTKNGVKTIYHLDGSQIAYEETAGNITVYLYDSNGLPVGMQYHGASYAEDAWDIYWFEKNLHGDVIAVYDEAGNKLIGYKYDAWGNTTISYYSNAVTTAKNNPFRYRGYYYDQDLKLYYLNTRYYDSNTGRFINADEVMSGVNGSLQGFNLYVYCFNNPIMMYDNSGHWPKWLKKIGKEVKDFFGAAASYTKTLFKREETLLSEISPISITTGICSEKITEQGNSNAPISVYANADLSSLIDSSSIGARVNIKDFSVDIGVALDDIGVSALVREGNEENSIRLKLNFKKLQLGIESYHTTTNAQGIRTTEFTNVSVNGWAAVYAYIFLTTGQQARVSTN